MIEESLYKYLKDNIENVDSLSYGNIEEDFNWEEGKTSVNFFKISSQSDSASPSYLDIFQISVRNKSITAVQTVVNSIIELFHLYSGMMEEYRIWVIDVSTIGTLWEDERVYSTSLNLSLKYTLL